MPQSIYDEAAQAAHHDTIHRFRVSSVQHEITHLRKVVPTAAAIAMATVNSSGVAEQLHQKDDPLIHNNLTGQTERPAP